MWFAWALYWALSALPWRPVRRRQPFLQRLAHLAFMGLGFILFFSDDSRFGPLHARFLPHSRLNQPVAIVLTALGLALAVWARVALGRNWSAEVVIREGHQLIRRGPYARIRHPIYTGLLLAQLGAVIAIGELRALVAFAIFTLGFYLKARDEEHLLAREFGEEFERHKRETGLFLPRLMRPAS